MFDFHHIMRRLSSSFYFLFRATLKPRQIKAPGLLTILSYPEVESWSLQAAPQSGLPNPTWLPTDFIVTRLFNRRKPNFIRHLYKRKLLHFRQRNLVHSFPCPYFFISSFHSTWIFLSHLFNPAPSPAGYYKEPKIKPNKTGAVMIWTRKSSFSFNSPLNKERLLSVNYETFNYRYQCVSMFRWRR